MQQRREEDGDMILFRAYGIDQVAIAIQKSSLSRVVLTVGTLVFTMQEIIL